MKWYLALIVLLVPGLVLAQERTGAYKPKPVAETDAKPEAGAPDNLHGLSETQLEHIKENNVGRAEELVVGDLAPDFDLPSIDETSRTSLVAFRGKRPVVLFFGSYT